MKKLRLKKILFTILAFAIAGYVQAQCNDWKWPEDKAAAEEKNVLYTDALRNSDFEGAKGPHQWLLQNAPD